MPIVYMGSVYHAQADAFRDLLSALKTTGGEFHLHLFTSQSPSIVTGCGLDGPHLTRHDHVAAEEVPAILSAASLLYLPLGFDTGIPEVIRTASPAKLGDYLRSGRPILAHVPGDSFVAQFCRYYDCALVVDQPDVAALADAARTLARGGPDVTRMVANAMAVAEQFRAERALQEFWSNVDRAVMRDQSIRSPTSGSDAEMPESAPSFIGRFGGEELYNAGLPEAPLLLFVGTLSPLKGPDLLVEAFAQVSRDFRDVCLLLIGPDRGMRAALVARVRSLGIEERVHFRASWDEPMRREAYLRAVALVVPSRSEVMPSAALEAGAAGVPALVTEACNFSEVAQIGGGLVVAPTSAALAEGLSQMLGDRAGLQRMGERLSAFVRERCRWLDGDPETIVGSPGGIASPHLPPAKFGCPQARVTDSARDADNVMLSAALTHESLKKRARRRAKKLLTVIPAVDRYISEKHVIAAERDQAVEDRIRYESLLKDERAATNALLAARNQVIKRLENNLQAFHQRERAERDILEKELSERRQREILLKSERALHLERIWGRPRIEALSRVLFVSDIPPCTNYSGGILIKEMIESVDCLVENAFILLNDALSPKIPSMLEQRLNMQLETKPMEFYASDKYDEKWIRDKEKQSLAVIERDTLPRLLKFAESSGCSAFWVLLEGQSMIRLAHALTDATQHPIHVQVTDPPAGWLRQHSVDAESSREILDKFDFVLRRASSLAAASWSMADAYQERYGVRAVPMVGSLPASMARPPAPCASTDSAFKIGFAGQFYATEEWGSLHDAIDILQSEVNGIGIEVHVHSSQKTPAPRRQSAGRIHVHGWLDTAPLIDRLSTYDLLYCPYWFDEIHREDAELCFPSKIATYLAAGRPILFHGPVYSSPSRFLEKWEAAFICNDPQPRGLASTLRRALSDRALYGRTSRQGRQAFDENLTQEHLAKAVCRFLQV